MIVLLTMRRSPHETPLERLVSALRAESIQRTGQDLARATESIPRSRGILLSATEWREKSRFVVPVDWSIRQKKHSCPLQVSGKTPYNYSQAAARCCLACSLGVGPNDIAEMYAEWNEEGILGRSSAQWLKDTMTKLGLSRRSSRTFLVSAKRR